MTCLAVILIIIVVFLIFYKPNVTENFINMDNINMYSNGKQLFRKTHRNVKTGIKNTFYNLKGTVNRRLRETFLN
jgi:hypothetical protein